MFSVFNANLQTDMVKTIVGRQLTTTDTQSVWRELSEHRRTSSKGVSEKRRLTLYITNSVPDDNVKGTIEQFVLHLNEQFRQLDEITDDSEKLPSTVNSPYSKLLSEATIISGLSKVWMKSRVPPMDILHISLLPNIL